MKSVTTDYASELSAPDLLVANARPIRITTQLRNGLTSKKETDYDLFQYASIGVLAKTVATRMNPTEVRDFDFGPGSPGPLVRRTTYSYLHDGIPGYAALNIVNKPTSVTVFDGSGKQVSQTNYEYDVYTRPGQPMQRSGAVQHDSSYDIQYLTRGNLTGTSRWNNIDGSFITTQNQYDDAGNITGIRDPRGNTTTLSYADSWMNNACAPSGGNAALAPTAITNALGQTSTRTYNSCTGSLASSSDGNMQKTSYSYGMYDRLTRTDFPDHSWSSTCYSDDLSGTCPSSGVLFSKITHSGMDRSEWSYADGLGRIKQKQVQGGGSTIHVDYGYDPQGRLGSVSNPYFTTGDTSYGLTTFGYDGVGRLTTSLLPDGSTRSRTYDLTAVGAATVTTQTDEAKQTTAYLNDAQGNLVGVVEPTSVSTIYGLDTLGNVTSVNQMGNSGEQARIRSFTYDSFSRLLTSTNPETGTICYGTTSNQVPTASNCQPNGYDPNGNLIYRTDATGQTTSYRYDALNRMTFSFKPDGSSNGWGYDGNDENGNPIAGLTNSIGRLSHISNRVNAAENFGYDPMGRLNFQSACLPSACNYTTQVSALYDLAGNMTDLTYPDGQKVHFDIGSDGRVKDAGDGTVTGNYAQSLLYNPDGSLGTLVYGNGALQQVITQNNRLQVQSMAVTDPLSQNGTTYLAKTYCYVNCATGGSANNGNIWVITDSLNGSRTQGFTYDNLNRISSFSFGGQLAQQYAIDSFGNMSGMVNGNATTTFDANNRISNLPCASSTAPYDAKGNQLCSTDQNGMVSQYVYDAENRISSINTLNGQASPFVSYIYGADGQRVRKQDNNNGYTEYVSFNGQTIAEKDQNGTWTDYVFADGKRIAKVTPTSDPHLHIEGTATSGGSYYLFTFPIAPYTFKAGDRLVFRQYQTPGSRGGVNVVTTNGNYTAWQETDQDGQVCNDDGVTGQWHNRSIDLSRLQGLQLGALALSGDQGSSGHWSIDFADMSVVSTDGTVTTWYNGQDVTPSQIGGPGTQNPSSAFLTTPEPNLPGSTLFYVSDHLGSAAMEFASGGWPISSAQYAPFGAELASNTFTANHYKFTGKERDAESGLDYFGARYYSSSMGRWMSPDWADKPEAVPYSSLDSPQSLNLYGYVLNNPLRNEDADGHDCCNGLKRFVSGVVDTTVAPIGQAVRHPGDTAVGLGMAVVHPLSTLGAMKDAALATGEAALSGDAYALGEVAGTAVATFSGVEAAEDVARIGQAAKVTEGIYEFSDATAAGKTYVGQSGRLAERLDEHAASGKLAQGTEVKTTAVPGGKTAREVAEQKRMDQLGGKTSNPGSQTSNRRNSVSPDRMKKIDGQS